MSDRWFPIMGLHGTKWWLPWAMLAPHEAQAQSNHSQTLERLAERGGLGPDEAFAVLTDRPWRDVRDLDFNQASLELAKFVAADSIERNTSLRAALLQTVEALTSMRDVLAQESFEPEDLPHAEVAAAIAAARKALP